ncbi:oligosaccharide flippase family protein [Vagococcus fluvialis]|uniref:oligosaccharide flippase family protein n=1 Tax=Vagococcus fluvialis TaxID=2738 RepID=UPI003B5AC850
MKKFSGIIKNILYTVSSNLLSLVVSIVVSLLLPKILGVSEYGYYQLYIFYVSYVGILHFGWCDGIYLRYGGFEYSDLNKKKMAGQVYEFILFQLVITFIFCVILFFTNDPDINKRFVLYAAVFNIIIMNLRMFQLLILQTTNRMKEYSFVLLIDRFFYVIIVLVFIFLNETNVRVYILIDIFAKLASLILAIAMCKEIFFVPNIQFSMSETKLNIFSGINLMLANVASMLIIGIVRFGIQDNWSIETFGKISLTLSISNMLMVFVGAVSLAIFPIIKRTSKKNYNQIYPNIRTIIMPLILILLILYFPVEIILSEWLPQYRESLKYMVIVFPMVVFESKVSLLTNTFLKAMRKEKEIFKVNFISACSSIVLTLIFVYLLDNLFLSMVSIVVLLGIRSTLSEYYLRKSLEIKIYKDIILELILVFVFIYFGWNFKKIYALIIYIIFLSIYFIIKRKDLKNVIMMIKQS